MDGARTDWHSISELRHKPIRTRDVPLSIDINSTSLWSSLRHPSSSESSADSSLQCSAWVPAFPPKSHSFLKSIYVPNSQQLSSRKGLSAFLAQLGERTTEDRKVPCSIHVGGITFCSFLFFSLCLNFFAPVRFDPLLSWVVTWATLRSSRLRSDRPVLSQRVESRRVDYALPLTPSWTRHATAHAHANGSADRATPTSSQPPATRTAASPRRNAALSHSEPVAKGW